MGFDVMVAPDREYVLIVIQDPTAVDVAAPGILLPPPEREDRLRPGGHSAAIPEQVAPQQVYEQQVAPQQVYEQQVYEQQVYEQQVYEQQVHEQQVHEAQPVEPAAATLNVQVPAGVGP